MICKVPVLRCQTRHLHSILQIDGRWRLGEQFSLADLVIYLSGKCPGVLMQGMLKPCKSLLRALSRTDEEMRCLLTDLVCTGLDFAFSQLFHKPFVQMRSHTCSFTNLMPLLALGTGSAQLCPPRARCMQCCIFITLTSALFCRAPSARRPTT